MNQYSIKYVVDEQVKREVVFAESEEALREGMQTHAMVTGMEIESVVTYGGLLGAVRIIGQARSMYHNPGIVTVRF